MNTAERFARGSDHADVGRSFVKRTPLPRSTKPIARNVPVKNKRPGPPRRTTIHRDRDYLDWLQDRKCVVTGKTPCDPAHGPSAGSKVKGPDKGAIPLIRELHVEQHSIGWPDFEKKYGIDREKEAAAHYALYLIDKENQ